VREEGMELVVEEADRRRVYRVRVRRVSPEQTPAEKPA
jgi:hypothetical protein